MCEWMLVFLLLYMLPLPQGQCWVSVLIGFRTEEKSSTRHMGRLGDKGPVGTGTQWPPILPRQVLLLCVCCRFSALLRTVCVFSRPFYRMFVLYLHLCLLLHLYVAVGHRFTSVVLSLFCIPSCFFCVSS